MRVQAEPFAVPIRRRSCQRVGSQPRSIRKRIRRTRLRPRSTGLITDRTSIDDFCEISTRLSDQMNHRVVFSSPPRTVSTESSALGEQKMRSMISRSRTPDWSNFQSRMSTSSSCKCRYSAISRMREEGPAGRERIGTLGAARGSELRFEDVVWPIGARLWHGPTPSIGGSSAPSREVFVHDVEEISMAGIYTSDTGPIDNGDGAGSRRLYYSYCFCAPDAVSSTHFLRCHF